MSILYKKSVYSAHIFQGNSFEYIGQETC